MKFITLTNYGYRILTSNFIESLKKIGIDNKLIIHCTCPKTLKYFNDNYPQCLSVLVENNITTGKINFQEKDWKEINFLKFKIILPYLEAGEDVLYSDGDIVYFKSPFSYLEKEIGDHDLLIQSDGSMKNPDTLCCGFYLIKANERTIKFLKPLSLDNYEHDQDYFNKEKANINYKLLPHNFFPNGRIFYKFKRGMKVKNFNPYLIHFNWVKKFYFKEKLMKKFDMWYLDKKQI